MGLWRCQNEDCSDDANGRLIFDFENDTGICPKCGANPKAPGGANVVVARTVIHLMVKDAAGPITGSRGKLRIACAPTATKHPPAATGVPSAASCPACRASDDFKRLDGDVLPAAVAPPAAGVKVAGDVQPPPSVSWPVPVAPAATVAPVTPPAPAKTSN